MKSEHSEDTIHKEVVIIGNGPSGIALSYMLSGNVPYVVSTSHPDEMLSARLETAIGQCLINADLEFLSSGLEGRSTNPISLLVDALLQPCADIGLEMDSLIEFRKDGKEIDHVVLGKGPPGGSWHKMDPQILTLSLGNWMSLPGLPFVSRDSGEKRAYASSVANYYVQYVQKMGLSKYFNNNVSVTSIRPVAKAKRHSLENSDKCDVNWVEKLNENDCLSMNGENTENKFKRNIISNALNYIWNRGNKTSYKCCKRPREDQMLHEQSPDRKIREIDLETDHSGEKSNLRYIQPCNLNILCDSNNSNFSSNWLRDKRSRDNSEVPSSYKVTECRCGEDVNWMVETRDLENGTIRTYTCKYVVLASGCNDIPNKLSITMRSEPDWLVYDLRTLESRLDSKTGNCKTNKLDPVLVVGAGLSAADAVIALRGRNVPVIHAFRNKSADLNRQLPENMYPEYHKVHQMMQDGGSNYPLYSSYPEYTLNKLNEAKHTVTLSNRNGQQVELKVSHIIVLIGSSPDLSFLPEEFNIAIKHNQPIDGKTNAVNIDKMNHRVRGYKNLFAVGTLAGDNFVRFIPGGALAVLSELCKKNEVDET
ncbi:hypothetical protein WA026_017849 [Henosepilachna vigintioctopunctata]|uniref:Uncharacterized protein n=1 Tax=Henosepilachna vigintioctopunctata TaxID=420089 RepID=A0AAW1TWB2_9CUCU